METSDGDLCEYGATGGAIDTADVGEWRHAPDLYRQRFKAPADKVGVGLRVSGGRRAGVPWEEPVLQSPSHLTRAKILAKEQAQSAFPLFSRPTSAEVKAKLKSWAETIAKSEAALHVASAKYVGSIPEVIEFGVERVERLGLTFLSGDPTDPVAEACARALAFRHEEMVLLFEERGPCFLGRLIETLGSYIESAKRDPFLPFINTLIGLGLLQAWDVARAIIQDPDGFHWLVFLEHLGEHRGLGHFKGLDTKALIEQFAAARVRGDALGNTDLAAMGYSTMDLESLSANQRRIFSGLVSRAIEESRTAGPKLESRVQSLGFSSVQLEAARHYLASAATIAIGWSPEQRVAREAKETVVDGLIREGRYRTSFETGITGERAMREWGDRMASLPILAKRRERLVFGPGADFEKDGHPVYAACANSPLLSAYGDALLVLDPSVRRRATVSFPNSTHVGTPFALDHVLLHASDQTLTRILQASVAPEGRKPTIPALFEYHVFGGIELARDAVAVVASRFLRGSLIQDKLFELAKMYQLSFQWTDELKA